MLSIWLNRSAGLKVDLGAAYDNRFAGRFDLQVGRGVEPDLARQELNKAAITVFQAEAFIRVVETEDLASGRAHHESSHAAAVQHVVGQPFRPEESAENDSLRRVAAGA